MCPNVLVLMCDQLQARAVYDECCHTPNLDRLRARGVSFTRAFTPNAVCSPARASLMTGKLPHNHNVMWVTHTMSPDQVRIREGLPHFAQELTAAGYTTSYVGKWHVEPSERPDWYGWQRDRSMHSAAMARRSVRPAGTLLPHLTVGGEGYRTTTLAGVTSVPPDDRPLGTVVAQAREELRELATGGTKPWCLFVSVPEPHDPYIVGLEAYRRYDRWESPLPENWSDDLAGRPRIYQRAASAFAGLSNEDRELAARCYYASVTEIDQQFGLILDELDERGLADETVVVLLTDHGDYLGAHGMYCKNIGAWEEAYNVPLVVAGPGIGAGPGTTADSTCTPLCSSARVGTHALFPSLMRHYGIPSSIDCDAPLFDDVLAATSDDGVSDVDGRARPATALERADADHREGLAEYHGGRLLLTQRVFYRDKWKLVWNGFDDHEFYNLAHDPGELVNLARPDGPAHDRATAEGAAYRELSGAMWCEIERTGDRTLLNSQYVGLRASEIGPEARNW